MDVFERQRTSSALTDPETCSGTFKGVSCFVKLTLFLRNLLSLFVKHARQLKYEDVFLSRSRHELNSNACSTCNFNMDDKI